MTEIQIQYVADPHGNLTNVLVPIDLWREIEAPRPFRVAVGDRFYGGEFAERVGRGRGFGAVFFLERGHARFVVGEELGLHGGLGEGAHGDPGHQPARGAQGPHREPGVDERGDQEEGDE